MAWVRPRNPKPKVAVDHTQSRKDLLLYFSGKRARPNPKKIDRPQILDSTLQDFARNKTITASQPPRKHNPEYRQSKQSPCQQQQRVAVIADDQQDFDYLEEEEPVSPPRRRVVERHEYLHTAPPKTKCNARPSPKATSRRVPRDWETLERPLERPEGLSWEERSITSSRWASAITPLPGLV